MAQGGLKVKTKIPNKKEKKSKGSAVSKRANRPQKPKKKLEEAHKLKQIITKTVNKAVEQEIRSRASQGQKNLSKAQQAVAQYHAGGSKSKEKGT